MSNDDFAGQARKRRSRVILGKPGTIHDLQRLTGGANRNDVVVRCGGDVAALTAANRAANASCSSATQTFDPVAGIVPQIDSRGAGAR